MTPTIERITVSARFNGPPTSANGGYACGLVAAAIGASASVRLLQPPPLEAAMIRRRDEDGTVRLLHGEATVAEGRAAEPPTLEPPQRPDWAEAMRAALNYPGRDPEAHPFPDCFVCGPLRAADGLRIFPGPAGEGGLLAAPWQPEPDLARDEIVDPIFVWCALDCPSGFACIPPGTRTVLATMTAAIHAPVRCDRRYVVTGWPIAGEGRKHRGGSAIHDADGELVAVADTLWITLRA